MPGSIAARIALSPFPPSSRRHNSCTIASVFVGTLAVLHVIRPSRGKAVVQALFGTIQPTVWVSDMLGSQRGHAVEWQVTPESSIDACCPVARPPRSATHTKSPM